MPPTKSLLTRTLPFLPLVLVLGALLVALPPVLYLLGDDFGYVDNLLRTHWAGRYVPAQWLAPTNFTVAWLGSAILHVTGRFWLATLGVNLIAAIGLAGVTVAALAALGVRRERALLGAGLLLAHPFVFGVFIMYTGFPLYLLLTVSVVWACAKERPTLATLLAVAATLTRQSGIALFVLIAAYGLRGADLKTGLRSLVERRVVVAAAGALGAVVMVATLPKGWAGQGYGTTQALLSEFSLKGVLATMGCLIVCWGQATALGQFLIRRGRLRFSRRNLLMGGSVALVLAATSLSHLVSIETRYHVNWPRKLSILWHLSLSCFLLIDYERLKYRPVALWALAVAALLLVRGIIWDYYTIEAFIAFLVSAVLAKEDAAFDGPSDVKQWPWGALAIGSLGIVFAMANAYTGLIQQRANQADVVLLETAQRSKQIPVTESVMPFGMAGWKLLEKYVAEEEHVAQKNCLNCFLSYAADARYIVYPERVYRGALARGEIDRELTVRRLGRILSDDFHLVALKQPMAAAPHLDLRAPSSPFRRHPLTNAEWDELVRHGSYQLD